MLIVVTGPPCAGKSTYVAANARPGDIRIDFDDLAQALGCTQRHGYGDRDPIWHVTLAARNAAIKTAIDQHRNGATVWIVDCVITPWRSKQYAEAGARTVLINDASPAELHRRADLERPGWWHGRIDEWLATGGQPARNDPAPAARTRW